MGSTSWSTSFSLSLVFDAGAYDGAKTKYTSTTTSATASRVSRESVMCKTKNHNDYDPLPLSQHPHPFQSSRGQTFGNDVVRVVLKGLREASDELLAHHPRIKRNHGGLPKKIKKKLGN